MEDRPPPNPEKLLRQFRDWIEGTELPGRTMSNLKTGFLPDVLAGVERGDVVALTEAWQRWEDGETDPAGVLETLRDRDLENLLSGLTGTG